MRWGVTISQSYVLAVAAGLLIIGFFGALAYAWSVGSIWEDWYITYQVSKNFGLGYGLVYRPGEYVHAFTSPLGVLLPGLIAWVLPPHADAEVLWVYRVITALAWSLGAAGLWLLGSRHGLGWLAAGLLMLGYLADAKSVAFSMNGMETGLMVFFVVLSLVALHRPGAPQAALLLGVAWAGLQWTRPDGCVYIAAMAAGWWLFSPGRSRWESAKWLIQAGAVAVLLYLPWFLFAAAYYGNPVPHSLQAKGLYYVLNPGWLERVQELLLFPVNSFAPLTSIDSLFSPTYAVVFGGWPDSVILLGRLAAWIAAFAWVLPMLNGRVRAVSFALLLLHAYMSVWVKMIFPWYLPPVAVLSYWVWAYLLQASWDYAARLVWTKQARVAMALVVAGWTVAHLWLFYQSARQLYWHQTLVEQSARQPLAEWLAVQAQPEDTVFLECLGYFGFFSGLKMYDFPGLASPEVVATRLRLRTSEWVTLKREMEPDWLITRAADHPVIRKQDEAFLETEYELVRVADVSEAVASVPELYGRPFLQFDQQFFLYHRR